MLGEVRGLKTGVYWNREDNVSIEIAVNDDGVKIVMSDYEVDTFWEFVIDTETYLVANSDIGSITEMEEE